VSTPYNRTIKAIVIHHQGDGLPPSVSILERWNPPHPGYPNGYDLPEYDYGIEANGLVRVGRPLTVQGAHCLSDKPAYSQRGDQWWNRNSIGIGLAGDFTIYPMPQAQFDALVTLVKRLMGEHGLTLDDVYPHGQVTYTSCPGSTYSKVPALKGKWSYDKFEQAVLIEKKDEVLDMLKVAVLLFTKDDFWAGADVAAKNGNCAVFVRAEDRSIPADAKNSQKLYIVGGGSVGHPNEILLSGKDKYQTAAAVAKYLGGN